jgi:uncharacterized damage-inducible protein DinB
VKRSAVKGSKQMIQEIKKPLLIKQKHLYKKTNDAELSQKQFFFVGPKSKLQILNLMQDHHTHHRAQILVYLNLNQPAAQILVGNFSDRYLK